MFQEQEYYRQLIAEIHANVQKTKELVELSNSEVAEASEVIKRTQEALERSRLLITTNHSATVLLAHWLS